MIQEATRSQGGEQASPLQVLTSEAWYLPAVEFLLDPGVAEHAITCFGRLACICPALLRRRRSYRGSMAAFHPGCRFDALRAPLASPEGSSSSRSRQRQCARRATASARCSSRTPATRTPAGSSWGPDHPAPSPRCLFPTARRHKVRGRAQVAVSAVGLMAKPVKYTCTSTSGPLLGPAGPASALMRARGNEAASNVASIPPPCRFPGVTSPRPPASQHSKWQGWAGRRDPNRHWGTDRAPKDPPGAGGPGGGGWRE